MYKQSLYEYSVIVDLLQINGNFTNRSYILPPSSPLSPIHQTAPGNIAQFHRHFFQRCSLLMGFLRYLSSFIITIFVTEGSNQHQRIVHMLLMWHNGA